MNTEHRTDPPEPTPTDAEIADAIAAGAAKRAVALMTTSYGEPLGRVCMALVGDQDAAEDLSMSTLTTAYSTVEKFPTSSSVKAWLFGIARQTCARHLEKHRSKKPANAPLRSEPQRAREVLRRMVPSERELLALRYQGGLSYAELSHVYSTTPKAARKRVAQALKHAHDLGSSEEAQ